MAGIAALWLSFPEPAHRRNIETLRDRDALPKAFRYALQHASRPVSGGPSGFGAGIVDAGALMDVDLSSMVEARPSSLVAPRGWCPGPSASAFRALESEFRDAPNGRERVSHLIGAPDLCAAPLLADETAFWSTVDDSVAAAFGPLLGVRAPSAGDFEKARRALLARDVSARLRAALAGAR
jgi:hypothetical protein